jgi:hypothetical protein
VLVEAPRGVDDAGLEIYDHRVRDVDPGGLTAEEGAPPSDSRGRPARDAPRAPGPRTEGGARSACPLPTRARGAIQDK